MRWQLFAAFGLIILIALGTVAVVAQYAAAREVQTFLRHGGQEGLENLSASLENYYAQNDSWSGVESVLSSGSGRGRGRGAGGNSEQGNHVLANAEGVIVYDGTDGSFGESLSAGALNNAITLRVSDDTVGYLLPETGIPEYPQNFDTLLVERINRATFFSALISGAVAVLLAAVFAGIIQKPVRDLTKAANKMSKGDLSQRVHVRGKGEMAALGETFNDMAQSLQDAASRRKAMTADIAHELRNPLAVQRAQLEAIQDGVYPMDKDQLHRLYMQNQTLSHLVEDLRLLALADAGELALDQTKTDLALLCLDVIKNFEPQTVQKNIQLTTDLYSDEFFVYADKERLRQIINNLMQNAMRYTPEGGQIKVTLKRVDGDVSLEIFNSGPQMSDETLAHLFERFYRGDRGRDRAGGGTGLGLSIARKLAEAHHGRLTGANNPDGGVLFTLTLPLIGSK
jgi:signal transduction histidine kinase